MRRVPLKCAGARTRMRDRHSRQRELAAGRRPGRRPARSRTPPPWNITATATVGMFGVSCYAFCFWILRIGVPARHDTVA
eukprot:679991-Prymnesium_polylepis.1